MTKKIMIGLGILTGVMVMAAVVSNCESEYKYVPNPKAPGMGKNDSTPLTPAQQARKAQIEDSLWREAKMKLHQGMTDVLKTYQPNHKNNKHTGYFLTNFDSDTIPEMWVVIGNLAETFRLELYYPLPNGSLERSQVYTGFGTYYKGDKYLKSAVKNGPDYLSINQITIRKGELYADEIESINLTEDPNAKLPQFKEKEIQLIPFSNLAPLNQALGMTSKSAP